MLNTLVNWLWMKTPSICFLHSFGSFPVPLQVTYRVMDWILSDLRVFLVTLIPFFTFSTFHALGYIRTNVIPNVFPRPASSGDAAVTWQAKTQQQIKSLTDKYYGNAMRFVAQSEVTVIAVRLFFGLFR
jgi:hypothetical protein